MGALLYAFWRYSIVSSILSGISKRSDLKQNMSSVLLLFKDRNQRRKRQMNDKARSYQVLLKIYEGCPSLSLHHVSEELVHDLLLAHLWSLVSNWCLDMVHLDLRLTHLLLLLISHLLKSYLLKLQLLILELLLFNDVQLVHRRLLNRVLLMVHLSLL